MSLAQAQSNRYDAFLSHSSKDKKIVEQLARILESCGSIRTFLDRWHLIPGEPWQEELEVALRNSSTCVVAIGPDGLGPWQNEEMRAALEQRVSGQKGRVIPTLLPGVDSAVLDALPLFLKRLTMVDLRGGLHDEWALHQLMSGIQGRPPGSNAIESKNLIQFQVVLSARISEANLPVLQAVTQHLRELTSDTHLTIVKVSQGSIILTISADSKSLELLLELFNSGNLSHLSGMPVISIVRLPAADKLVASIDPLGEASNTPNKQMPAYRSRAGNKLYVGNLPKSISDDSLLQAFSQFGEVLSAKVMMERDTGRSKGFGFVEMGSDADAQAAIAGMNGQPLQGRSVVVNEAIPLVRDEGAVGGGGQTRRH